MRSCEASVAGRNAARTPRSAAESPPDPTRGWPGLGAGPGHPEPRRERARTLSPVDVDHAAGTLTDARTQL